MGGDGSKTGRSDEPGSLSSTDGLGGHSDGGDLSEAGDLGAAGETPLRLIISETLRHSMEERRVKERYIRHVITYAERMSDKLMHVSTGHFIAHRQMGNITCWVEYVPEGSAYKVFRVYMHRMKIEGDTDGPNGRRQLDLP